jgi:hypothetical protein
VKIISADERMQQPRGLSIVLAGVSGIGKTSQVKTLDPVSTLVVDSDRGALPLRGTSVGIVHPDGWQEVADLFCLIGGPNKSLSPTAAYSEAHFQKINGALDISRYSTFVFDSITAIGRDSFRYAEQLPESFTRSGTKDTRAAYGQHARQMISGLQHVQRGAPTKVIVLTAILGRVTDELNRPEWRIQLEGERTARELPAIVDEIITMQWLDFGDGKPPMRAFICTSPNSWGVPAKDRSGKLDQVEPPDLGKLIAKILQPSEQQTASAP